MNSRRSRVFFLLVIVLFFMTNSAYSSEVSAPLCQELQFDKDLSVVDITYTPWPSPILKLLLLPAANVQVKKEWQGAVISGVERGKSGQVLAMHLVEECSPRRLAWQYDESQQHLKIDCSMKEGLRRLRAQGKIYHLYAQEKVQNSATEGQKVGEVEENSTRGKVAGRVFLKNGEMSKKKMAKIDLVGEGQVEYLRFHSPQQELPSIAAESGENLTIFCDFPQLEPPSTDLVELIKKSRYIDSLSCITSGGFLRCQIKLLPQNIYSISSSFFSDMFELQFQISASSVNPSK